MSEQPETIELDRLALLIGHKEILIMRQQDQIGVLMAQLAKLQKPQSLAAVDTLAKARAGAVMERGKPDAE